MSTIRLSGTSSGYYDLTVPAAAGTNSIDLSNLPVKDSNGRLGIGTSSPTSKLHIVDGAGANIAIQSTAGSHWRLGDAVGSTNGYFVIYDYTNSGKRLEINNSGHVTMPNQPAWHGTHTDNYATTFNGGTAFSMVSGAEKYNVGNHFNYSNDRFTAPVSGYYLLYGWDIRENGREGTGVGLGAYKNGLGSSNRVVSSYHQHQRGYGFTHVEYLAASDWVSFGVTEGGGVAGLFYGSTSYSGYGVRLLS